MNGVALKRLGSPDETRTFEKGRFDIVTLGGMTIGRACYEPGWKWSEHVGMVVSGRAIVQMDDGTEYELTPGDFFHIAPGHDSWVFGDEPYVSLHFMGSEQYAAAT